MIATVISFGENQECCERYPRVERSLISREEQLRDHFDFGDDPEVLGNTLIFSPWHVGNDEEVDGGFAPARLPK